ncbi:MAG TPA: FAD-dependent monooxygenase [Candidatus Binataceae bacterium]|nr:FAD-dependent monooxygenase [Candidatus Binataceae bacterium]
MSQQQASATETAVLVVGAGPTGLMMASELARQGIACRIIEKAPEISPLSKALAIHARTLEIFENIGIADGFVTRGVKAHGGSIYSGGKRIVHFLFNNLDSRFPYALMLPQNETEALLGAHLETFGLKVERSKELIGITQDADGITASLRRSDGSEEKCRASYLVGCDGAHSTVRHALNLAFEGEEYTEVFALADIMIDSSMPDDEIVGFASEKGLVFFFPISNGRYRMMADVPPPAPPGEPSVQELQAIVDTQCNLPARLHDPKWTAYFKIHHRQVASYRVGRAFLAGDAAHIHSPAGGQGMNTGLQDAYNLAWKLAAFIKGVVTPAVLDSYAPERHEVGKQVLKMTDTMTRVMELRNPVVTGIRDRLVSRLASTAIFQNAAGRQMSELDVNFRDSPIVGEYHEGILSAFAAFGGPRAGDRAPDADGLKVAGASRRLFDLLKGDKHKLLLLAAGEDAAELAQLGTIARQVEAQYGKCIATFLVTNKPAVPIPGWQGATILDSAGALHRAYHAATAGVYLVRPDGYVAYRSFPPNVGHLAEFLSRIFV